MGIDTAKYIDFLKESSTIDLSKQKFDALTIRQMQEAEGVTEALKAVDQLEWVRRMNSIRNRAEEIILREIVFNTYKNQAFA